MDDSEKFKQSTPDKKKPHNINGVKKNETEHDNYLPYLDKQSIANLQLCNVVFTGKIRINLKFPKEAYIAAPDGGPDILVPGVWERNRALDGDEVYAIVQPTIPNGKKSLKAVVVGIKTSFHNRVVVGTLSIPKGQNFGVLRSTDPRLPAVRIPVSNLPKERTNLLFASRIAQWTNVKFALS